ncbi:prolyl oligopeptidase family serine peptidase [Streptomyces sp. NPDC056820]|uniref:S9 family peptidase n=1 Tax=Streptomyces sp. NPDC056820 TaxID=3345951 RepID=UPI0036A6CBE9
MPPPTAALSSDGRHAAWVVDGNEVWGATRTTTHAQWDTPHRDLTIRGTVGDAAFSPNGRQLAFENPRDNHGFIAVFDYRTRRISYVDPVFATDSDPVWSKDGKDITFVRHVDGLTDRTVTKPVPSLSAWKLPPGRDGDSYSFASLLAAPIAYQPEPSADGRTVAYVSWESTRRAINVMHVGKKATRVADYPKDDGIELSQLNVSSEGGAVAYVRGSSPNNKGETLNPRSLPDPVSRQVWVVPTDAHTAPIPLGDGYQPRFSPDDERLVWTNGQSVMSADLTWKNGKLRKVGMPTTLFTFTGSLSTPRFSPDGTRLAYQRGSAVEVYDLTTGSTWAVPHTGASDAAPCWSPDGHSLALRRTVSGQPWAIWLADPATQQTRQIWQADTGVGSTFYGLDQNTTFEAQPGDQLLWSANGQIAFAWERDGWRHLYTVPTTGGSARLLTPGEGEVESAALTPDRTRLVYSTNIGDTGRRHLASVAFAGGAPTAVTGGRTSQWAPTPLADGTLAYVNASWSQPPSVTVRDARGATTTASLPQIPASFPGDRLLEPKLVDFPATDGQRAYGQLFVPKHPTGCSVIFPHGGPRRAMLPGFHYYDTYSVLYEMNQYLASHGCVVLSVDYRGGIMHGYNFRTAPGTGGTNASEYRDILGGVDFLRARSDVNPDEMSIYGLSWGGYIASLGLARNSDIFKVGFDIAGVHGAAVTEIDGLTSPLMLVQGDDDRNVDFQHGMDLAQALQTHHPDGEFVQRAYPNEMHEIYLTYQDLVDTYNSGAQFLLDHLPQSDRPKN